MFAKKTKRKSYPLGTPGGADIAFYVGDRYEARTGHG
jgi:hypothetical protein